MGALARYPIAMAPGMGLNAYFTYTVVKQMGVPWQAALGAVFLSGVAFLVLTAAGVRQLIISTIPFELYAAVAEVLAWVYRINRYRYFSERNQT